MEGHLAFGVEEGNNLQVFSPSMFSSFEKSSAEAKGALQAAETFCKTFMNRWLTMIAN